MAAGPKAVGICIVSESFRDRFSARRRSAAAGYFARIVDYGAFGNGDFDDDRRKYSRRSCRTTSNECSPIRRSRTPVTRSSDLSAREWPQRSKRGCSNRRGRVLYADLRRHKSRCTGDRYASRRRKTTAAPNLKITTASVSNRRFWHLRFRCLCFRCSVCL